MSAPDIKLTVTQRDRLKSLKLELSHVVHPGRVMLCRNRTIIGYCDVDELGLTKSVVERANTICLAPADFDDVKRWIG